jgi:hypothetical protein
MKIVNNSNLDLNNLEEILDDFYSFAKKRLNFSIDPEICFQSDDVNAKYALGKTAFYNPEKKSITIFVDGRHPKDIMRSLSHELVHHTQNCNGQFDQGYATKEGYAQEDDHLREMEKEAYLEGNMCFRDWEDGYKQSNPLQERKERLFYKLLRNI